MRKQIMLILVILYIGCSSYKIRSKSSFPIEDTDYISCSCPINNSFVVTSDDNKRKIDDTILRYSARHTIILEPEIIHVEPVPVQVKTIILQETTPVVATIDDTRLQNVLKNKPDAEEVSVKTVRKRSWGLRGLEVIKGFQKQNKNPEQEDMDKFIGDRIDNVGRYRNQ